MNIKFRTFGMINEETGQFMVRIDKCCLFQSDTLQKAVELALNDFINETDKQMYEPYFGWCDVKGCENEGCSGGNAWSDTGYWTVCTKHSQEHREEKPQPQMKQKAIDREALRDPETGYLN